MAGRHATAAIIGAGDFIGAAIAKRFAAEGFTIFAGRRNADKLKPLVTDIETAGGKIVARELDARNEEAITGFLQAADAHASLDVCVFNIGANVNFPAARDHRACVPQSLGACLLCRLPLRTRGCPADVAAWQRLHIFTGATASVRGGIGYAAFASAKSGLRAVAQSMARELGPQNIHVAHLIIDAGVDTAFVRERIKQRGGAEALENLAPDQLMNPASVAEAYWQLYRQPRDAWTFELDLRPYRETW